MLTFVRGEKSMRKILKAIAMAIIVVFLMSCFAGLSKLPTVSADRNYDRTSEMAILISAWTMDSHEITPAQCKAMIDSVYTSKGVTFTAVKITYGYDPANGAQYTANRIGVWVAYFAQYYNVIYVASRSVFHINRKLTSSEYTTYYYDLAQVLNKYSQVKCFLGEEEPEANQTDPFTGAAIGNNLAYSSASDMMSYVTALHDTWHQYSSIPFTFESIPPEYYSNGALYNVDCWFFSSILATTYWNWIDSYQDVYAIDEWRYHEGVQLWADHVDWHNIHVGTRKIILGECFNLDCSQTEQLWDAFNHAGVRNDLAYAFWWQLSGSEPVPSNYAGQPYLYFGGGFEGHLWALLNMKTVSPNGIPSSGLVSCQTYSDSGSNIAQAIIYPSGGIPFGTGNVQFWATFNIDMFGADGSGNNAAVGYWAMRCLIYNNGIPVGVYNGYYSITAHYDGGSGVYLTFTYPNTAGTEVSYTMASKVVTNCWNWASITCTSSTTFKYGWEDPVSGVEHNSTFTGGSCIQAYPANIMSIAFGAFGGQLCKLYEGGIGFNSITAWADNFESGMSGWTTYYTQPSMVQQSGLMVPSNGPQWMLQHLKYGMDY